MTDEQRTQELIAECPPQEEGWPLLLDYFLHLAGGRRALAPSVSIVVPIVLGALATWSVLDQPVVPWVRWLTATFALLAGLYPRFTRR